MMYELNVSRNCGISYHVENEAETIKELRPIMEKLDENWIRWYLTKDGEDCLEEVCRIHSGIAKFMKEANKELKNGTNYLNRGHNP